MRAILGTGLAKTQIGLDKILWGSVNDTPNNKPKTNTTIVFPNPPIGNPLQSGVIPVLNVLNQVELCSVISESEFVLTTRHKKLALRPKAYKSLLFESDP